MCRSPLGSSLYCRQVRERHTDSPCPHLAGIGVEGGSYQHDPEHDISKVTPSYKVIGDLDQFIVSKDLSLWDVSNRTMELAFTESVVQYHREDISAPPAVFPGSLQYKVLKSCNLYPVEGIPNAKLGEYNFDKVDK